MGGIDANGGSARLPVVLIVLLISCFLLFYPFQIQISPDWTAKVIDENGQPVVQAEVMENWQEYSTEQVSHEENKHTGSDGIVHFPPHLLQVSIASRVRGCAHNIQMSGVHAGCGAFAHLVAFKCNYGFLLTDAGRTEGDEWQGWSEHMKATILLRHCPLGRSGFGCFSDEEMHNLDCLNKSRQENP